MGMDRVILMMVMCAGKRRQAASMTRSELDRKRKQPASRKRRHATRRKRKHAASRRNIHAASMKRQGIDTEKKYDTENRGDTEDREDTVEAMDLHETGQEMEGLEDYAALGNTKHVVFVDIE